MKKITILTISVTLIFAGLPLFATTTATESKEGTILSSNESYAQGVMDAERDVDAPGGFFWGFMFGIVGVGGTVLWAAFTDTTPMILPENVDTVYYLMGYEKTARNIRMRSALIGSGIGALIGGAIVYLAYFALGSLVYY